MDPDTTTSEEEPLHPDVVDGDQGDEDEEGTFVSEPSRLIRIASMTRAMLEEVRAAPLDEAGRRRLLSVYETSLEQLHDSLSPDLQEEMAAVFTPLTSENASESELRIVQAQLVGWLEGLFSGIQASLFSQHAAATAQLDEMRSRGSLERGEPRPGQYL